jgi:hypothetical protein
MSQIQYDVLLEMIRKIMYGRNNIKMDLERWNGVVWTGLVWLRIGTGGELL